MKVGKVNENEEKQNSELGLILATLTAVGMTEKEKEAETFMSKSEFDVKLSTSVAQLSYDKIDVNLKIEKMMNKNQSVTEHNLRVNRLAENMAACGEEIARLNNELSENAWAGLQMGEHDIEYFCIMEDIVLETLKVALCRVREKENVRLFMTEVTIGKRKINPVQDEEVVMNSDENRNLHQLERKKNNTPKLKNNIQKKKENTIPAPILNFLNQFYFKTKKIELNKQESEVKVVVNEKTEKETFMSKFN